MSFASSPLPLDRPRQSLRARLLWPLVAVSVLASIAVAVVSYVLASRSAQMQLANRYRSISIALETSSFPLTRNVLLSIAALTESQLIATTFDGKVTDSTLGSAGELEPLVAAVNHARLEEQSEGMMLVTHDGIRYRAGIFRRSRIAGAGGEPIWIIVLFDEASIRASRLRAVIAPLVTGLSTIALLTTITLMLTSRLIRRLSRLEKQVNMIAEGQFAMSLESGPPDEVGRLASAVDSMASQLRQMWQTLHQREGERLLHQVAAGLAHNLRNSLTGARMAIELFMRREQVSRHEALDVALHEIEQTESYVRRLLQVSSGRQEVDKPADVVQCLNDVRSSLDATGRHQGVSLHWTVDSNVNSARVADGPSLVAAVTNLVLNAIQCATDVSVDAIVQPDHERHLEEYESSSQTTCRRLRITISDNGPGPADSIRDQIFEPFVTTKSEGMGLGLPLVRRSAEHLGGEVSWERVSDRTIFTLVVNVQ